MRKKYSNQLFLCIQELELNHDDFTITDQLVDDLPASTLQYKHSPFSFTIRNERNTFDNFDFKFVQFAPEYPLSDYFPSSGFTNFENVIDGFKSWMKNHVDEYLSEENEPDLWDTFKAGNKSLNIDNINFEDTSKFSKEELKQIKMSINELKLLIQKEIKTSDEEQNLINDRLNYLIEATERLNKYDWKGLVLTTLIGVTTTLTLDTQKGQLLFELFKRVFSNMPKLI